MGDFIGFFWIVEKLFLIIKGILTASQTGGGNFNILLAFGLMFLLIFVIFGIGLCGTIFWIWMIVDCLQKKFKKSDDKLMWLIIIILLHFIGAGLYYFVAKTKKVF